jgi:hypothetical protein
VFSTNLQGERIMIRYLRKKDRFVVGLGRIRPEGTAVRCKNAEAAL